MEEITILPNSPAVCIADKSGCISMTLNVTYSTEPYENVRLTCWSRIFGEVAWSQNYITVHHGWSEIPRSVHLTAIDSTTCLLYLGKPKCLASRLLLVKLINGQVLSIVDIDEYSQAMPTYESNPSEPGVWLGLSQSAGRFNEALEKNGKLRRWSLRSQHFDAPQSFEIEGLRTPRNIVFTPYGRNLSDESRRLVAVTDYNFIAYVAEWWNGRFRLQFRIPNVSLDHGSMAFDNSCNLFVRDITMKSIRVWKKDGSEVVSGHVRYPAISDLCLAGSLLMNPSNGTLVICETQRWPRCCVLYDSALLLRRLLEEQDGRNKSYHKPAKRYLLDSCLGYQIAVTAPLTKLQEMTPVDEANAKLVLSGTWTRKSNVSNEVSRLKLSLAETW